MCHTTGRSLYALFSLLSLKLIKSSQVVFRSRFVHDQWRKVASPFLRWILNAILSNTIIYNRSSFIEWINYVIFWSGKKHCNCVRWNSERVRSGVTCATTSHQSFHLLMTHVVQSVSVLCNDVLCWQRIFIERYSMAEGIVKANNYYNMFLSPPNPNWVTMYFCESNRYVSMDDEIS